MAAISLMLFFSATFVFGRHPGSAAYRHYTAARRRMGLALLLLSFNYSVHLFAAPRFSHPEWGILLNICTYFLSSWLFGSSLMSLLVRDFNSPRRDLINVGCWASFSAVSALSIWISPQGLCDVIVLIAFSLVFMLYSLRLDHAKKLLTTTPDLTIADIAQRAGYMSLSNFTRLFTASEGIPPGRWRKEKGL